jgi:hypothetical protein
MLQCRQKSKNPAFVTKTGLLLNLKNKAVYLLLRLDAFSGLILLVSLTASTTTWVARLQRPLFHFIEGSGQAVQYHPDENSAPRSQPLHCSTIW